MFDWEFLRFWDLDLGILHTRNGLAPEAAKPPLQGQGLRGKGG